MTVARLKLMNKLSGGRVGLTLILLIMLAVSCTSRYRLDLFLIEDQTRTRVKVEKTEFMAGAVLGDPMSRDKVEPGDGNIVVLVTSSRGPTIEGEAQNLMSYDRHVRYRLFVQLATDFGPGAINLKDNSLVQLLGRYEVEAEDKLYYPTSGQLMIDSVASHKLFGTIDGQFQNRHGTNVTLVGKFKAKVSD